MTTYRELEVRRRVKSINAAREASAVDLGDLDTRVESRRSLSVATITTAGDATYSAAQLAGRKINRDPNGAPRTDTTDTAANIVAALGLTADGQFDVCYLLNSADAAEPITLAGGTGVTVENPAQTIGQSRAALLLFVRTGPTAVTVTIVGGA